ncbi:uncharacterized protein LOC142164697 [Nicotiana tabacum]|uniref:Uncharacterized protein LOC142164697 n=1 Tax=Nicotiana tabacum TaxID=4097 RepID=A0AC58S2C8_TOBAC
MTPPIAGKLDNWSNHGWFPKKAPLLRLCRAPTDHGWFFFFTSYYHERSAARYVQLRKTNVTAIHVDLPDCFAAALVAFCSSSTTPAASLLLELTMASCSCLQASSRKHQTHPPVISSSLHPVHRPSPSFAATAEAEAPSKQNQIQLLLLRLLLSTVYRYISCSSFVSASVKVFRSDNGTKFLNPQVAELLQTKGMIYQSSCIYTPQQNGVAERRHMLPSKTLQGKSPFEDLISHVPPLDHMRVFGCLGYVTDVRRSDKRAIPAVFLGYFMTQKGYKMYNLHSKGFTVSRDVVFKEDIFPFKYASSTIFSIFPVLDLNNPIIFSENKLPPYHIVPDVASPDDAPPHSHSESDSSTLYEDVVEPLIDPPPDSVVIPTESISSILPTIEPIAIRRSSIDSKSPIWLKPIVATLFLHVILYHHRTSNLCRSSEISALEENNTWSIVPLPPGKVPIGCDWVFKVKYTSVGAVERHKSRIVAKGVRVWCAKLASTPLETSSKLTSVEFDSFMHKECPSEANVEDKELENVGPYQRFIGRLLIVRYIKTAPGLGLLMPLEGLGRLEAYCNSDWETVARSSAEFRSTISTFAELTWLTGLFSELGIESPLPIDLHYDSKAAIQIVANPIFHERTKHIDIDCQFVREKIMQGLIKTHHVPTKKQQADLLTKNLGKVQHDYLLSKLKLKDLFQPSA